MGKRNGSDTYRARSAIGDVVYAVRLDDVVKIGFTSDLGDRVHTLKCINGSRSAEMLAVRFGTEADEQAIHTRLIGHRARGREYYHPTPEVLAVVNEMREDFGLPPIAA